MLRRGRPTINQATGEDNFNEIHPTTEIIREQSTTFLDDFFHCELFCRVRFCFSSFKKIVTVRFRIQREEENGGRQTRVFPRKKAWITFIHILLDGFVWLHLHTTYPPVENFTVILLVLLLGFHHSF